MSCRYLYYMYKFEILFEFIYRVTFSGRRVGRGVVVFYFIYLDVRYMYGLVFIIVGFI